MMILDVPYATIKPILWAFEKAEYIRLEKKDSKEKDIEYKERIYTFVKNTGAKSPSIINGDVYDYNTKSFFEHTVVKKEPKKRPPVAPRTRLKLLEAMTKKEMSKDEIALDAKVNGAGGGAKQEFLYLTLGGVIKRTDPIRRRDGKILFMIDMSKRDEFIAEIKARL